MKHPLEEGKTLDKYYQDQYSPALPAAEIQQALYGQFLPHDYSPSIELFKQGSLAKEIYFIDSGIVKLVRHEQDGQEMIVGLRTSNWVLGAASVVLQKPFPTSAETLTRCCLRRMPTEVFLCRLKSDAEFSWHIHRIHSYEIYDEVTHLAQLGRRSARHRLEQLLWQLASALKPSEIQKEVRLQLPLKYWEVAELIAVTPQHLSRVLKQMQDDGIIRQFKGWLIISDPQKLYHSSDFPA
jgi:CRP/FNR family transcriptional regulator, cyclic AMP receptor protein